MRAILPLAFGVLWTAFSLWLAIPWAENLSGLVGTPLAWLTIGGIAIGPGVINSVLLASLALERIPPIPPVPENGQLPDITVMVAAFNEAEHICETVASTLDSGIDFALIVVMVPGVILAFTGRFYVIGWLTGAVLLLNFVILRFMAWKQDAVWDNSGLERYRDPVGLFLYAVSFQAFVAPASLLGYLQTIARRRDLW